MLDFLEIKTKRTSKGVLEVHPKFKLAKTFDLMVRGRDFYAVWDEKARMWSTDELSVVSMVDEEIDKYCKKLNDEETIRKMYMSDPDTGVIDKWHKYVQKQMRDYYHPLDEKIIFANTQTSKRDYASKKLDYKFGEGTIDSYEELISTLYDPKERDKLEWAIGSIISGDSKKIQKFIVLYGSAGSGKSTVLNIIQSLFEGYCSTFDAKELASSNNAFALEAFRTNPLVSIQHDGDLSRIEDNTKLNSIVSHEKLLINEKFKGKYEARINAFLFMGTNKPVKITEAKSGLLRRLIDVRPSGRKIPYTDYVALMDDIYNELGAIAKHCLDRYNELGISYYDKYEPKDMMSSTNDTYDFVEQYYYDFKKKDQITLVDAWDLYQKYTGYANVPFPMSMRALRVELKNYFREFVADTKLDGKHVRNLYSGFMWEKFSYDKDDELIAIPNKSNSSWLIFDQEISLFDEFAKDWSAQLASDDENQVPMRKWDDVTTKLSDIDTKKVHYVKPPNYISLLVVDFDKKDENGKKDFERNIKEAEKWPPTYAELSKSGGGIHLCYIFNGDSSKIGRIYDEDVELKTFVGNASLRRRVSKCNDIPVATLDEGFGLPTKGGTGTIDWDGIKSEKMLRDIIDKDLRKQIWPNTKPSIDHIYSVLQNAYDNGIIFDVTDLQQKILAFGLKSTHQAQECLKVILKMKFKSDETLAGDPELDNSEKPIIIFDVEVYPNLFLICWKVYGKGREIVAMVNPSPSDVAELFKRGRCIGYNNRRYDNIICYYRIVGKSIIQLFDVSQRIVGHEKSASSGSANSLSYTDIFDFASATNKMSLKKWEIKLGIHHQEMDIPWDQPVPDELLGKVIEYCKNDVLATEAVFDHLQADFIARKILADLSGLTVNDTTNSHTIKILIGDIKDPQSNYIYTDLSTIFPGYEYDSLGIDKHRYNPDAKIVSGKSIYKGIDPGEGGRKIAHVGAYKNVALLDVVSMHPHSAIALNIFGDNITRRFQALVEARVAIKNGDYQKAIDYFRDEFGKDVSKYLTGTPEELAANAAGLADALKTAINSVYGLTAAGFDNALRDPNNVDNIVAKYGALFMINLEEEVIKRGYQVVHVSVDSIKIADATPEIIEFVTQYGKKYGYTFDHEATYDKMCIVNDAVYIAKYAPVEKCQSMYGYVPKKNTKHPNEWTATGAQFAQPYVFKTLFSHEKIEFKDMCETKSVTTALYLDYGAESGEHEYRFVGKVGEFTPILPGHGGGALMREKDGKYYSVTGTKRAKKSPSDPDVYYWLESEIVQTLEKEEYIDKSYYEALVNDAVKDISEYCDFEWFASDDPIPAPLGCYINVPEESDDEIPFN